MVFVLCGGSGSDSTVISEVISMSAFCGSSVVLWRRKCDPVVGTSKSKDMSSVKKGVAGSLMLFWLVGSGVGVSSDSNGGSRFGSWENFCFVLINGSDDVMAEFVGVSGDSPLFAILFPLFSSMKKV